MEKLEKFFIMIVLIITMIMLSVIAWGMVKPVLIENRNTAAIVKAISNQAKVLERHDIDIQQFKKEKEPVKQ